MEIEKQGGKPVVQDILQPLLSKAQVTDLMLVIARSGLSMGDTAWLAEAENGRVVVWASTTARFLFWPTRKNQMLGYLGPEDSAIVMPFLRVGDTLRVRIVGLTPEHLAPEGQAELHISVWGHPQYAPRPARTTPRLATESGKTRSPITTPPLHKKSG